MGVVYLTILVAVKGLRKEELSYIHPEHWHEQDKIFQHWEEAPQCSVWLGKTTSLCVCSNINVQTYHKPLIPICKKSTAAAIPQLQCLPLRLAKYEEQTYVYDRNNVIAEALSQVSPLKPESEDRDNFGTLQAHHITSEITPTGSWLEAATVATQVGQVPSQLKHQIFQGWPDTAKGIPETINPFWK